MWSLWVFLGCVLEGREVRWCGLCWFRDWDRPVPGQVKSRELEEACLAMYLFAKCGGSNTRRFE